MPNLFTVEKYIWTFVFWDVQSEKVISTKTYQVNKMKISSANTRKVDIFIVINDKDPP